MNFLDLVGSKVDIEARVRNIVIDHKSNTKMVILENVFMNGTYFRGHSYVKRSKRLRLVQDGDHITATALATAYFDPITHKQDKVGLTEFRSVKIHSRDMLPA